MKLIKINTKLIYSICFFLINSFLCAQNSKAFNYCGITHNNNGIELCKAIQYQFGSNLTISEAEKAVNKILKPLGLKKDFILVSCPDIDNAVAVTLPEDGIRYIVFDPNFMQDIIDNSSAWSNLWILAHEIGHHLLGHTSLPPSGKDAVSLKNSRQRELDADSFAGASMYKLGATLGESQQAIKEISSDYDDNFSTHPKLSKRLKAIRNGYNGASEVTSNLPTRPTKGAEHHYTNAGNFLINENYENAIVSYSSAINTNPNFALAYLGRGYSKYFLGLSKEAISDYTKCISINPKIATAYNNRATLREQTDDIEGALSDYTKAIQLAPDILIFYYNRASLKDDIDDFDGALRDYSSAIKINPNMARGFIERGDFFQFSIKNYRKAIDDYSKAISLEPNNSKLYEDRAYCKREIGNYSGSIEDYNKALSLNPVDGSIVMMRAYAYERWNKFKKAKKDFKKCCVEFNRNDCCQKLNN